MQGIERGRSPEDQATALRTSKPPFMNHHRIFAAVIGLLSAAPATAQVDLSPGYRAGEVQNLAGDRAYATFDDGRLLSFDGLSFEIYDEDGNLLSTLGGVSNFVFPSFVVLHPSEAYAVVGESSNGDLFRVDLVQSTVTPYANLNFNFDLAFVPGGDTAYVSAALGGFGAGNDIVRLDGLTGATEIVAHVEGPSGPVAISPSGDLYYVTQYGGSDWPPPLDEEDLLLWGADDLAGASSSNLLDETDADVLTSGLDGSSSMAVDPLSGRLFLINSNFQGFANEILAMDLDGTVLDTVASSFTSISNLESFPGAGPAIFAAHQPGGARLYVQNTDFGSSLRDRVRLEPARPAASYVGPAPGQSGPASITISGAEPDSSVTIMVAFVPDLVPGEVPNDLGYGFPVFTAFELVDLWRRTPPVSTDGSGDYTLSYDQPGSLGGQLVFQAIVYGAGGELLGTSDYVVNQ